MQLCNKEKIRNTEEKNKTVENCNNIISCSEISDYVSSNEENNNQI